jgi:hypothetical protein
LEDLKKRGFFHQDPSDSIRPWSALCRVLLRPNREAHQREAAVSKKQADYLGVPTEGPYKPEHDRY